MPHGLAHPPSRKSITSYGHCQIRPAVSVLIVVEGVHDVEFLRRLTSKLHPQHKSIPDLVRLEREARAIFIPFGGGHILPWGQRFAPLQCPEFHLYDSEIEPETALRRQAVELNNKRAGCRALLLSQRSLESYLHPAAIFDAGGASTQPGRTKISPPAWPVPGTRGRRLNVTGTNCPAGRGVAGQQTSNGG